MTKAYDDRPELDYFLTVAHVERAAAMARTAYLLTDAIGRGVGATLRGIAGGGHALARAVAAWRRRRDVLRALQALDDHLLLDIGLTRADLRAVANGRLPAMPDQERQPAAPTAIDVALGDSEAHCCNDNGSRRHAA